MDINKIKKLILTPEYDFLRDNPNLGNNLIVLGLGGSLAYGTNNENSDVDIRGFAMNSRDDLLLGRDFDSFVEPNTDTVIYSLKKAFNLLCQCNPNTIEILGLNDDQIIFKTLIWDKIKENSELFLSKRCINTFGGYANAQLRRLESKSARIIGQEQREKYILGSIENASVDFRARYQKMPTDAFKMYIGKSDKDDMDSEIMVDMTVSNYPLRDLADLFNDYRSVVKGYDKIGKRNSKAIEHNKIGKHMMHLVRLHYMAFDLLEKGVVKTYRDEEHDLLMSIRNGDFLDNGQPNDRFYKLVDDLEKRFNEAKANTKLPDDVNHKKVDELFLNIVKNCDLTHDMPFDRFLQNREKDMEKDNNPDIELE